nr:reverse transcriptase [Tanacetum cinerariifolium]
SCGGNGGRGGSMAGSGRGGVEKMSSTGSKLMVRGEECLEGYVGAGRGEKHLEMMEEPFGNRLEVIELEASIPFLSHIISAQGVQTDPKKIVSIQAWPTPSSFTHLRAFLGLTGYYRRFVPTYAHIASPLTDILKQATFTWNEKAANAFQSLKTAMSQLITLALPNFSKPFDITIDASGVAIGAVLSQKDKPISFFSKKLCDKMKEIPHTSENFMQLQRQ